MIQAMNDTSFNHCDLVIAAAAANVAVTVRNVAVAVAAVTYIDSP